jgi:hypothetical protein
VNGKFTKRLKGKTNEGGTEILQNISIHLYGYLRTELMSGSLLQGDLKIHIKLQYLILPICKCLETTAPVETSDVDRGRIRSVKEII